MTTDKAAAAEQIKGLYRLFVEKDCTMVEVRAGGRTEEIVKGTNRVVGEVGMPPRAAPQLAASASCNAPPASILPPAQRPCR